MLKVAFRYHRPSFLKITERSHFTKYVFQSLFQFTCVTFVFFVSSCCVVLVFCAFFMWYLLMNTGNIFFFSFCVVIIDITSVNSLPSLLFSSSRKLGTWKNLRPLHYSWNLKRELNLRSRVWKSLSSVTLEITCENSFWSVFNHLCGVGGGVCLWSFSAMFFFFFFFFLIMHKDKVDLSEVGIGSYVSWDLSCEFSR